MTNVNYEITLVKSSHFNPLRLLLNHRILLLGLPFRSDGMIHHPVFLKSNQHRKSLPSVEICLQPSTLYWFVSGLERWLSS